MNEPVTLRSIATHLNVSVSTVAKSLRGDQKISSKTTEMVRKAADELGYERNLGGVKLRTGNSYVILTLLGMSPDDGVGDSGSVGLLRGIHQCLEGTDYSVRVAPVFNDDNTIHQLKKAVAGRNADGVILDQIKFKDERVEFLLGHRIPFVTFGRDELCDHHAYFDLDNEKAAYDTTTRLIRGGARRIGLLEGKAEFSYVTQRLSGYRRALCENGIPFDETLVRHIPLEAQLAKAEATKLLENYGVDAINCVNELTMFAAHSAGQKSISAGGPPAKLAAVTNTNIGEYLGIDLIVSHHSRAAAGRKLASALMSQINGEPLSVAQNISPMITYQFNS